MARWVPMRALVDGPHRFVATEQDDQPLDLPPPTEPQMIADIARLVGKRCGLELRVGAMTGDQVGGISHGGGIGQVKLHCGWQVA